jgi:hypothetical protein
MNPYLENSWPDVHTRLIGYIADAIGVQLPRGLVARSEEAIEVDEIETADSRRARADIAVSESWRTGGAPKWNPEEHVGPGGIVAAMPEILDVEPEPARWVEIRTAAGKLVTIVEVISPSNRVAIGLSRYHEKQQSCRRGGVNLVEIDLLRIGESVLVAPIELLTPRVGTHYAICAFRASRSRCEVYRCPLRERLPAVSIPLRATDRDPVLDIQPLVDRCYEIGGYWQGDYSADPAPALAEDELRWVDERLREAGLRT